MVKDDRCGTTAGYWAHYYGNKDFCEPCREAMRAKDRERNKDPRRKQSMLEAQRRRREKNPEHFVEYRREWKDKNRESVRERHRRYKARARAKKYGVPFEFYTHQQVLDLYGTLCHICNEEIDLDAPRSIGAKGWEKSLHFDHVISLRNGGPDVLSNVRPAHGSCNMRKGTR